ncbi:MAG: hypothetical protein WA061_03080 [Microgenomates group bacterium]
MKISIRYKKPTRMEITSLTDGSVEFANFQFKSLMKKNLGLPVKTFRL